MSFTNKEILIDIQRKLDKIELKLNCTHEQAKITNGKVKMHSKLFWAIGGVLVTIVGWMISILLKGG